MSKFKITFIAYVLLATVPLQLMVYPVANASPIVVETDVNAVNSASIETGGEESSEGVSSEYFEESSEFIGGGGGGKKKKKNRKRWHRKKRKLMGGHSNYSDYVGNKNKFFKRKKQSGIVQTVLFVTVPLVVVAGLAVLFSNNTQSKNAAEVANNPNN